jgi:outer membrane protein OmpA-like peptidoglycan-associated protein
MAIQNERRGTSTVIVDGQVTSVKDDRDLWKGGVIGCAIGAPLCAVLAHVFLDPPAELPPPPSPMGEAGLTGGEALKQKAKIVLRGVYFDFDRAEIRPDSRPVLDEAAAILNANPDVRLVVVEGHTDALGSEEYNQALSIRRAEAVYQYLINAGVAPERMRTEGFGESRPVADNETEEGRAQNRRVELRVAQ